jgi:transposase
VSDNTTRDEGLAQGSAEFWDDDRRFIAMESTGVYWKPLYNILEGEFEIVLVNAQHIKFVPGRKTDVNDAQWIADLLQHGLVKGSFIPPLEQRDVRDLVRYRGQLIQERTREINRVQKVLETTNIKLGSVASNVLGVSGRDMLEQLIAGQDDPTILAQLARGRLREKIAELERALHGQIRTVHRTLLNLHLQHIDDLNTKITLLSEEIDHALAYLDRCEAIQRLDAIPGVNLQIAQVIVSELGLDMSRFPTVAHAASWTGVAPRREESAGRQRSTKTRKGNPYLKTSLIQAAHAAGRRKDNFLSAQYHRLAARRGKQRAAMVVAHSILVIVYYMLQRGTSYVELGADYFDKRNQQQLQHSLVKRLERLGLKVTLAPPDAA